MGKLILAALLLIPILGEAATSTPSCTPQSLKPLYRSVTRALCSANYVTDLLFEKGSAMVGDKELANFIANNSSVDSPVMCGIVALGTMGIVSVLQLADMTRGRLVFNNQVTKSEAEKRLANLEKATSEDIYVRNERLSLRKLLKRIEENPRHHLIETYDLKWGRFYYRGPNKVAYAANKIALRTLMGVAAVTGIGAAIETVGYVAGADNLDCSDAAMRFYTTDPSNNCAPIPSLGPEVLTFLKMTDEDQHKALENYPKLCDVYTNLSKAIDKELDQQFKISKSDYKCSNGSADSNVTWDNAASAKIAYDGSKAKAVDDSGSEYNIAFTKDNSGGLHVDSVTGTFRKRNGRTYNMNKFSYNLPPSANDMKSPYFQDIMANVARIASTIDLNSRLHPNCADNTQSVDDGKKPETER